MVRIAVLYPNNPGATFDHAYYAERHCPMVYERLKSYGCLRLEIDRGLAGQTPDAPAPFVCIGYIVIKTLEGFQQGMAEQGNDILGDIPNYTTITPILQISEMVAS